MQHLATHGSIHCILDFFPPLLLGLGYGPAVRDSSITSYSVLDIFKTKGTREQERGFLSNIVRRMQTDRFPSVQPPGHMTPDLMNPPVFIYVAFSSQESPTYLLTLFDYIEPRAASYSFSRTVIFSGFCGPVHSSPTTPT
jgi:hypothetical protein